MRGDGDEGGCGCRLGVDLIIRPKSDGRLRGR